MSVQPTPHEVLDELHVILREHDEHRPGPALAAELRAWEAERSAIVDAITKYIPKAREWGVSRVVFRRSASFQ